MSSKKRLFVGYDGSIYVFDTSTGESGKTLTKYSIPSNITQVQENPTLQSSLEIGTIRVGKDGATLVYISEGEFIMGTDNGHPDEQPAHKVNLSSFWIDQTEVTNELFSTFVSATGYQTDAERLGSTNWQHPELGSDISNKAKHPVVHVSWNDAVAYCSWADRRLPTEAEWEKAASWNDLTQEKYVYPWGNKFDGSLFNFCDINCAFDWADINSDDGYSNTAPVGNYPNGASPYGILDMAGNVWEWVNDWYSETYYQVSPLSNPLGPDSGDARVLRGGSFHIYGGAFARTVSRGAEYEPTLSVYDLGFRCAMDATP